MIPWNWETTWVLWKSSKHSNIESTLQPLGKFGPHNLKETRTDRTAEAPPHGQRSMSGGFPPPPEPRHGRLPRPTGGDVTGSPAERPLITVFKKEPWAPGFPMARTLAPPIRSGNLYSPFQLPSGNFRERRRCCARILRWA